MKFDYVFFDSGGTLYSPGTGVDMSPSQVAAENAKRVHALLGGMGVDLNFGRLKETLNRQEDLWRKRLGKAYNFLRLMEEVVDELHLALGKEEAACLADAYAGPRYASWLFPGTKDAFRTLNEDGCRLGIIANTAWLGFCMDRAFAGVGLLPFLGIRIYSGDIGIAKPDLAIFRLAEQLSGFAGKRILYVGNDVDADIKGAAAAGWSTAFRCSNNLTTAGLANVEFDHISELVRYCLD